MISAVLRFSTVNRIFFSLAAVASLLSLSGCLGGSEDTPAATTTATGTLTLVSYTTSVATLTAQGQINYPGVVASSVVQFHATATCSDSPIGQGLSSDLGGAGVTIQVPSATQSTIYVAAVGLPYCEFFAIYNASHPAPGVPTFVSTSPASPSRVSYTPLVVGNPSPSTAIVNLFSDSACANLVGSGSASAFATVGIWVTLRSNATTSIYAEAVEPFGNASACGFLTKYTHTTTGPNAPVFVSIAPTSPSNQSATPTVVGSVDATTVNLTLFSDAACSVPLKSGTAANFTTVGLQFTVQQNATTSVYGVSYDSNGSPSVCGFLTSFTNDTIGPATPPVFVSSTPGLELPSDPACVSAPCSCRSPATTCVTNATIHPLIIGSSFALDAVAVGLFKNAGCTIQIGSGPMSTFSGAGVAANIVPNSTTSIYAESFDAAGNASQCTLLLNYTHNTVAPDAPSITAILPATYSNKTTTPTIQGTTTTSTANVLFFSDIACANSINSGTAADFNQNGITVNASPTNPAPSKFATTIYAQSEDAEGNLSTCTLLTTFNYSNIPAPAPTFSRTVPSSPSRFTSTPSVVGNADSTIVTVALFSDNQCVAQIGSGTRATFTGAGIQITAANNTRTTVYAVATDLYSNQSACTPLLNSMCTGSTLSPGVCTYIYETRAPSNPVFASINPHVPGSPSQPLANNYQTAPTLFGSVPVDPLNNALVPLTVNFYDTFCFNSLGAGSPTSFGSSNGIQINVPSTSQITQIVAQTSDAAGNLSSCIPMTNYTFDNSTPGKPIFSASLPASPSYTQSTAISGTITASADTSILPMSDYNYTVVLYSDQCQTQLAQGAPSLFTSSGIQTIALENQTTTIYGAVFDSIGNFSTCNELLSYTQNDIGPANLLASQNTDGTVSLSWMPDQTASPAPVYIVKRALVSHGPYTVLAWANASTSFKDKSVTNGATYYYVVDATNDTGASHDSNEYPITVSATPPGGVVTQTLTALPGFGQVTLNWTGMSSDSTFQVLRATQTGGPYTTIASGIVGSTYIDLAVTNGTAYFYVVVGFNADGTSVQSTEANAVPLGQSGAPTNLVATPITNTPTCAYNGGTGVQLTWSSPSYYNSFVIKRSNSPGTETLYQTVIGSSNTFIDCSPYYYSNNNFYSYYTVTALWGGQSSANSNEVVFASDPAPSLAAASGLSSVYLTWIANSGVPSSYTISRSLTSGGPYVPVAINQTGISYNDTGLTNGIAYFYVIQAVYSNGAQTWQSAEVSAIPGSNPAAPTNLRVVTDVNGVFRYPELFWTPPVAYDTFNVYYSTTSGGSLIPLAQNLTTPTYVDVSGHLGLIYYVVTATWGSSYETPVSNQVSYRHGYATALTPTATTTNIGLVWTAVAGANHYSVYRSLLSGTGYSLLATAPSNSYTDSSETANTGYFYYVVANFADGSSGESSPEASAMSPGTGTATNIPSGLTATSTTATGAALTWANVNATATYKIYQSPTLNGTYVLLGTSPLNSYSVGGLAAATTYYFKVASVVSGVTSTLSSALAVTSYGAVNAPTLTPGNTSMNVTWNGASGATSYYLTRSTDGVNYAMVSGSTTTNAYFNDGVTNGTPLVNGTLYFYILNAVFPGGTVASPASVPATVGLVSEAPQGLTVVGNTTGNSITLNWGAVPAATAFSVTYNVYCSTTSGSFISTPVTSSGTTTATVTNCPLTLSSGTPYYFAVTALIGTYESSKSTQVEGIPFVTPAAPWATVASGNVNVFVNWTPVIGATSYDLQRSIDGVNFTTLPAGTGISATGFSGFTDMTAVAATGYVYRYLPYMSGFPLTVSNISTTVVSTVTYAPTPLNLTAVVNASNENVYLNWAQSASATSYNLYRTTTNGSFGSVYKNIATPMTSYTDSGAANGTTYYYGITAVNTSGTESPISNIVSVSSLSAPGQPTATVGGNAITVTWPSTGAPNYIVRRAIVQTPAPLTYGVVATVSSVSGTSYQDTNVANGVAYNYVIDSVSASGTVSPDSPVASATAVVIMNLEVPIELADQGLASDVVPITFGRTQTSLDPTAYDGTITYSFELSATNYDSSGKTVSLLNSSGSVVASISVPAGTTSPTRIRSVFQMTPINPDTYFVALPATTSAFELSVFSARMIVTQVGASKTKIFIPLLASSGNPINADATIPVALSSSMTYSQLATTTLYQRNTAVLSTLAGENAWELETITSASGGAAGVVGLYDQTQSAAVADTESIFNSSSETFIQAPFSEGTTDFASANQGDFYQVGIRCTSGCTGGNLMLYKAGLWVTLTSLSKVEVIYRISLGDSAATTQTVNGERSVINLNAFSHPTTYFQAVGAESGADTATVSLFDVGTADSGTSSQSLVTGSGILFSSTTPTWMRSGSLLLNTGDRFLPQVAPTTMTFNLIDSAVVIDASR